MKLKTPFTSRKWISSVALAFFACAPLACASNSEEPADMETDPEVESTSDAIIGGRAATETYSFMVSLSNGCGGALVTPQWIVTANHCGSASSGRVGSIRKTSGGEPIRIDRRVTKPGTDLTLMHITAPVQAAPIKMAETAPTAGTRARLIGFGCTSWPRCTQPSILQEIDLSVLDPSRCRAGGGTSIDVCISGDRTHSACHGDSGGPAITGSTGNWTLVGETHGPGDNNGECATTTLYTGIAGHLPWIRQQIGSGI
ncbi:S1 family peptidase [Pendulispora albinea]|uniref:Trypsin-like serine protease n=1 Tax=Pendulispora albinea TaxID=2741071 RepID=A0ABZ2LVT5_9BACT